MQDRDISRMKLKSAAFKDLGQSFGWVDDTTQVPYRYIYLLEITWPDDSVTSGTGFALNLSNQENYIVVTAGHCLYNTYKGGYATNVCLYQAIQGGDMPYGPGVDFNQDSFCVSHGWGEERILSQDYGCIVVAPGYGGMGYAIMDDASLGDVVPFNAGYVSLVEGDPQEDHMFETSDYQISSVSEEYFYYNLLLNNHVVGQSGSPVWRVSGGSHEVVGMITGLQHGGTYTSQCYCVRFTATLIGYLQSWAGVS